MARLLRTAVPGDATRDVSALCRAVAFNWLVLGTDAHAKNYSLLLAGSQARLAPLYDIASMAPYDVHPRKLKLAQKVGGEYRPTVIEGRHWDRLARAAAIDPDRLRSGIVDMIDRIPDAMSDAASASDLTGHELTAASRLIDSIARWLRHCRQAVGTAEAG
jgi:serine/threonine-protein kinase HipA